MAFVIDKEEIKPGLIIFRRGDVAHRRWYCRVKLPKADRYKTYSLKTTDISSAREMAQEKADDVRYALKYNGAVFIRPFNEVAEEYAKIIDGRARSGEITLQRAAAVRSVIKCQLNRYVGPIQVRPGVVTETFVWNDITLEAAYEADWLGSSDGPYPVSHLAITSTAPAKAPLPITETGYLSHFLEPGTVEEAGGPAVYVRAWLDHAARDVRWRKAEQARRQLDLFR